MIKSTRPIIEHLPRFLDYCEIEKGLSSNTQENYHRFLRRFVDWLKITGKEDLKPHELTTEHIWNYRLYLSRKYKHRGKNLKKVTQNLYLIALRALLSYFTEKDIVSLPKDKVKLPKNARSEKTIKFLNLEQIEKLLLAPNTKTKTGLRDRAILETIIHTGLKVSQLVNLNWDQIEIDNYYMTAKSKRIYLPKETLYWIKKYLDTRKDKSKALFINYRGKKPKSRLTPRSIERIVKKYERKIGLPFSITPEILRWAYARALLEEQNKPKIIREPQTHKTFVLKGYKPPLNKRKQKHLKAQNSPAWHIIENVINKEIDWFKKRISFLPEGYKRNPLSLGDDTMLRKIAILIVKGKVKAVEFRAKRNKDFWDGLTQKMGFKIRSYHGEEWHRKMMSIIYDYFKDRNYKVVLEPILHYGRADLGIYFNSKQVLYVEVGTVSLYKLWHNLSSMKNSTFLIIPSEKYAIELQV